MTDVKKFTGAREVRSLLNEPFNFRGYSISSNGHMLVANKKENDIYSDIHKSLVPPVSKFLDLFESSSFRDYVKPKEPEKKTCSICSGKGKKHETKTCIECEGEGEVELYNAHNTYYFECATCDGDQVTPTDKIVECNNCLGTGKEYDRFAFAKVLGKALNYKYLHLIESEFKHLKVSESEGAILFKGNDSYGALLEIRNV